MKITIVTINYNGSDRTIRLLETLKNQTDQDFEIIVIDNASQENDSQYLENYIKSHFPKVTFQKMAENLGFSGGNNIGIKEALKNGSNWVLLLNNDVLVKSDFMASVKAILGLKTEVIGLSLDEGQRTAYYGKIQWLKPTLHIYKPLPKNKKSGVYAIGGAVLINKEVFEKIGLFDEKYFLYFEDADFSKRAADAGFKIEFAPEIKVRHEVAASTSKLGSPLLLRYHYRNALYFNNKLGPRYAKILLWPGSWIIIAKQIIKILFNINVQQSQAILNGIIDFYKNKTGQIYD